MQINEIKGSEAFYYLRTGANKIRWSDESRPYFLLITMINQESIYS